MSEFDLTTGADEKTPNGTPAPFRTRIRALCHSGGEELAALRLERARLIKIPIRTAEDEAWARRFTWCITTSQYHPGLPITAWDAKVQGTTTQWRPKGSPPASPSLAYVPQPMPSFELTGGAKILSVLIKVIAVGVVAVLSFGFRIVGKMGPTDQGPAVLGLILGIGLVIALYYLIIWALKWPRRRDWKREQASLARAAKQAEEAEAKVVTETAAEKELIEREARKILEAERLQDRIQKRAAELRAEQSETQNADEAGG